MKIRSGSVVLISTALIAPIFASSTLAFADQRKVTPFGYANQIVDPVISHGSAVVPSRMGTYHKGIILNKTSQKIYVMVTPPPNVRFASGVITIINTLSSVKDFVTNLKSAPAVLASFKTAFSGWAGKNSVDNGWKVLKEAWKVANSGIDILEAPQDLKDNVGKARRAVSDLLADWTEIDPGQNKKVLGDSPLERLKKDYILTALTEINAKGERLSVFRVDASKKEICKAEIGTGIDWPWVVENNGVYRMDDEKGTMGFHKKQKSKDPKKRTEYAHASWSCETASAS
ncbi:hypothetical protein ACH4YO_42785 [Streptomyces noursei]|uniref:hypothetical protein n=1 Tax=Streptomyces noursei TaxID=1971 RepID=UPI0033E96E5A